MDISNPENLTAEEIMSTELLEEVYTETDEVQRFLLINKLEKRAEELRILSKFKQMVRLQEKQLKEMRKEIAVKAATEPDSANSNSMSLEFEPGNIVFARTGRWIVTESGVRAIGFAGTITASHYPIIVTERLINRETHREKVQVTWKKDGRVCSIMPYRSEMSSNSKIVNLSDYGLPVTSETARAMISYLSDYEALNNDLIPLRESTSKLGWIDNEFLPYSAKDIIFDAHPSFKYVFDSVHEEGDYNAWLGLMRSIRARGRIEVSVYLAASFASVLLPLLNVLPFIVNLYGESGRGKTVALMAATSVWADPGTGKYIVESTSTVNSMEQQLGILNHLPMMIDDLSKIRDKDPERFPELIYMLCAGRGKSRLMRTMEMRDVATWDNVILTNIERPLCDSAMKGGAINRVLDIETEPGDIFENGNATVGILLKHYGHGGKPFIEAVEALGKDTLQEMVDSYEQKIRDAAVAKGEPKEAKQVIPLAVLLTADEIAEREIFQDGVRLDLHKCVDFIKGQNEVSEMRRAYDHVMDAVHMQRNRFEPREDGNYAGVIWGSFPTEDTVAIIPSALEELGRFYNFNSRQFVRWAGANNLLQCDGDKKRLQTRTSIMGKRYRTYVLKLTEEMRENVQHEQNQDEEFIDYEQDELPFD